MHCLLILLYHFTFCCRMIGPEMPSAELLAAAAKLTEAQAELRYLLTVFKKNMLQSIIILLRIHA